MPKYQNYIVLEKIPQAPLYIFSLADAGFVNPYFKKVYKLPVGPGDHLNIFDNEDFIFCYQLDSLRKCAQNIFDKLVDNPQWGIEMDGLILKNAREFFNYSKKISRLNLAKLSNKELAKISHDWFFKYFYDSWVSGWPAVLVDFERNLFSNHLLNYLKQKIKQKKYSVSVGDVFSILTTPLENTFAEKETNHMFSLLAEVKKDQKLVRLLRLGDTAAITNNWPLINKKTWQKFNKHVENFCWLPHMYVGPAWDKKYFIESLVSLLRTNSNPKNNLQKLAEKKLQTAKLQKKYYHDLEIHPHFKILFKVAQRFVYSKSARKDAMYYSCYVIDRVLREIARRTFLSIQQVRRVYPWEIGDLLNGKGPNLTIINKRQYAVHFSSEDKRVTIEGEAAKKFLKKFKFSKQELLTPREILGDCASVGKVRGVVKIINSPKEINKMANGNILVSYATSPDIMPAIRKAAAIVTDLGGIICHAAIVSRELRVPCVVGTKIATQVFKDGDVVEVDATHGIVRIIH